MSNSGLKERIEYCLLLSMENIIQVLNDFEKEKSIKKAIVNLDKLRIYIRLLMDMEIIKFDLYHKIQKKINELSNQMNKSHRIIRDLVLNLKINPKIKGKA